MKITQLASKAKLSSAFALLVIVAIAPLSASAFAQYSASDASGVAVSPSGVTIAPIEPPHVLPVEPDVMPPEPPMSNDVFFDGTTQGWIIINKIAYESEISISGSAYHLRDGMWQLDATGIISAFDRHADMELSGFAVDDILVLHGKGTLDTGEPIRVFLRGHFAPTLESGVFALAFTHAGISNEENGERFPLMQTGFVNVYPIIVDTLPEPYPLPEPTPYPEPAPEAIELG